MSAALGGFIGGLAGGIELRQKWKQTADDKKEREEDRRLRLEDRNYARNEKARDRQERAEDRARRNKLEDLKLLEHTEDRKRQKELEAREDEDYFEEKGDKTAAKQAHKKAKAARDKDLDVKESADNKRAAGLGLLPPTDTAHGFVLPGSPLERAAQPGAPRAPAAPAPAAPGFEPYPAPYEPDPRAPQPLGASPAPEGSPQLPAPPAPATPPQGGLLSTLNPFGAAQAEERRPGDGRGIMKVPGPGPTVDQTAPGAPIPASPDELTRAMPRQPLTAAAAGMPAAPQLLGPPPAAVQSADPHAPGVPEGQGWMAERFGAGQITTMAQPNAAPEVDVGASPVAPAAPGSPQVQSADGYGGAASRGLVNPAAYPPLPPAGEAAPGGAVAAETPAPAPGATGPRMPGTPSPAADGAGYLRQPPPATADVPDFMHYYRTQGVPEIVEHYLATGRPVEAETFQKWASDQATQAGMEAWGRGVVAASRGDESGFLDSMIDAYNTTGYYEDGFSIDRQSSGIERDKAGNVTGVKITLKDKAGKTQERLFADDPSTGTNEAIDRLYESGIEFMAPNKVYEYGLAQLAAAKEKAEAEEKAAQSAFDKAYELLTKDPVFNMLPVEEKRARVEQYLADREAVRTPKRASAAGVVPPDFADDE